LMLQSYFVLTSRNIHGPDPWWISHGKYINILLLTPYFA